GRFDQQLRSGLGAAQHVRVVVHRAHRQLGDGEPGQLPEGGWTAGHDPPAVHRYNQAWAGMTGSDPGGSTRRSLPSARPVSQASKAGAEPCTSTWPPAPTDSRTAPTTAVNGGTSSRRPSARIASARARETNGAGQSPGEYPASRSTWWISTSRSRSQTTRRAGMADPAPPGP